MSDRNSVRGARVIHMIGNRLCLWEIYLKKIFDSRAPPSTNVDASVTGVEIHKENQRAAMHWY